MLKSLYIPDEEWLKKYSDISQKYVNKGWEIPKLELSRDVRDAINAELNRLEEKLSINLEEITFEEYYKNLNIILSKKQEELLLSCFKTINDDISKKMTKSVITYKTHQSLCFLYKKDIEKVYHILNKYFKEKHNIKIDFGTFDDGSVLSIHYR